MLPIVTHLTGADVIDNHVTNFFRAMFLVGQIFRKRGSRDFGHMLVLSDGEHLIFGEAAKSDAILKGNHAHDPCFCAASSLHTSASSDH